MDVAGPLFGGLDFIMREAALFAATGFLILGLSDLAVDLVWLGLRARTLGRPLPAVEAMPSPERPGRLAVFVPAWDEAAVIGDMLRGAVAAWQGGDWRIYVGTYPNDPATTAAAAAAALADPRDQGRHRRRAGADDQGRLPEPAVARAARRRGGGGDGRRRR
jgi:adsorption protein B